MSQPTRDGNQQPDPKEGQDRDQQPDPNREPDPQPDPNREPDPQPDPIQEPYFDQAQGQDQTSGSVFSDPTATVWAEPTAPMPTPATEAPSDSVQDTPPVPSVPPTAPGAAYSSGQQPETAPPATPQAAPPASNPYAQQPPAQPYGQPTDQYGQPQPGQQYPAYGQPQPGQPYPAYGQQPYTTGAPAPSNTSAIILTIVSGLAMLTTCVIGIPSLIFGIMALTSNSTDPVDSRKKARTGWIVFAINAGVVVLVAIIGVIALVALSSNGGSNFNSEFGS